jgi:protein gp37
MGKDSSIEWTHHTFNPWRGCTKVSEGCRNCYAERDSKRNLKVLGQWGPNGTRVVASESKWREPLAWDRAAEKAGERHRVFCASIADVFEDWSGPMLNSAGLELMKWRMGMDSDNMCDSTDEGYAYRPEDYVSVTMSHIRERLFFLIRDTPNLDWLLLTKRPENVISALAKIDVCDVAETFPNVWFGTSVENQQAADERIPHLLSIPAAVRFLSCEPLLGPVDLTTVKTPHTVIDAVTGSESNVGRGIGGQWASRSCNKIDWVIVGGESGPNARPMCPEWAYSLRDQCVAARVAFFMKQMGGVKDKRGDIEAIPEGLRIRELPDAQR